MRQLLLAGFNLEPPTGAPRAGSAPSYSRWTFHDIFTTDVLVQGRGRAFGGQDYLGCMRLRLGLAPIIESGEAHRRRKPDAVSGLF